MRLLTARNTMLGISNAACRKIPSRVRSRNLMVAATRETQDFAKRTRYPFSLFFYFLRAPPPVWWPPTVSMMDAFYDHIKPGPAVHFGPPFVIRIPVLPRLRSN